MTGDAAGRDLRAEFRDEQWRRRVEAARTEAAGYRALLVEALARLDAIERLPGDPGGPLYHARRGDDWRPWWRTR